MAKLIKIWLDDVRPAPEGYEWAHSVNEAKALVEVNENIGNPIVCLDLDHDMGDYEPQGGDGIKFVLWLAETNRHYPIKVHSLNVVGKANMEAIVRRYW